MAKADQTVALQLVDDLRQALAELVALVAIAVDLLKVAKVLQ